MRGPAVKPIMIAAGGTGGHFFPAEALATELVARGHRVALMTDARAAAKLPPIFAGGEVFVLRGAGIAGRGLRRGAMAIGALAMGTLAAHRLLGKMEPAAIVGFGGYPTVAPVTATRFMSNPPPVVLHEQNAVLGRANRAMAKRAKVLALSFAETAKLPAGVATVLTGNPVRPGFDFAMEESFTKVVIREPNHSDSILVIGGSLGARVFADLVPPAITDLPAHLRQRLRVVQQCRPEDLERVKAHYAAYGVEAELASFFTDMPERMKAAMLIIARAGASTVSEIAAVGRPAFLIPLPSAIDDHQTANARVLAEAGGAWLLPQSDLTVDALRAQLEAALANPKVMSQASNALLATAERRSAARLADLVLQYAKVST
jgi:UDP-N-acetylglucosamine--N-acetylmuramyl-(pentapeptide) pyrophosphoryl-undecaprenol N-acetylglucosamine transferase